MTVADKASQRALEKRQEEQLSISGVGIGGLRGFDASDLPIPYVKVVNPTSKNVEMEDGKDAPQGTFFFARTKTAKESIDAIILDVVKGEQTWDSETEPREVYRMIAVDSETWEPFSFLISGTSRWEWKKFLGVITAPGTPISNLWDAVTKMTTEKVEGEKGKWYISKFNLGSVLSGEKKEKAMSMANRYAVPQVEENENDAFDLDEIDQLLEVDNA